MPNRVRFLVAFFSIAYSSVLIQVLIQGWWFASVIWFGFGLLLLDYFWIRFDLAGATYWRGASKVKQLALTFDDGPDPRHTSDLLDRLKSLNIRATFFILGRQAEQHPELVRRIIADGHEIGSHGYTHRKLGLASPKTIGSEMTRWEKSVEAIVPLPKNRWFRPPHGIKNFLIRRIANSRGYRLAGWSRGVWDTDRVDAKTIAERVTQGIRPGDVILLHDGDGGGNQEDRSQTVAAVTPLVQNLREEGFSFLTLSELFPHPKRRIELGPLLLGCFITVIGILYVLRSFEPFEIQRNLMVATPALLLASIALDFLSLTLKSQAWRELILPMRPVRRRSALAYYLVGNLMNNLLPFRGGDLSRADLLGRKEKIRRIYGLSTTILEGLINGVALLPLLAVAMFFSPLPKFLRLSLVQFGVLILSTLLLVYLLVGKTKHRWLDGLRSIREHRRMFFAFLYYLVAWGTYFASLSVMVRACALHVSIWAVPVIALALTVSMFIPSAPARLGAFEGAIVLSLAIFGIPAPRALGFALILHATQTLPTLLWGGLSWLLVELPEVALPAKV